MPGLDGFSASFIDPLDEINYQVYGGALEYVRYHFPEEEDQPIYHLFVKKVGEDSRDRMQAVLQIPDAVFKKEAVDFASTDNREQFQYLGGRLRICFNKDGIPFITRIGRW